MEVVYFSILQICGDAVSHGGSVMQDEDVIRKEFLAEWRFCAKDCRI
jgi:hypothetical protein